ncbi:MAG TPA: galactokinase [Puia sp.]|jgi:galactokinase|nr:galactokinase [Puia sp.]
MSLPALVKEQHIALFPGTDPLVVRSPGRVNLIGEHTDYNQGFVLPAAIDKAIYLAISPRHDDEIHLVSHDLDQRFTCTLDLPEPSSLHWPNYLLGVVQQLQQAGHPPAGFNCVFAGDIPLGAGMSSSAALECATAYALNELFGLGLDKLTMVRLSQRAENVYVGLQCGIMDMFASMFGRQDQVIRLDCQSLGYAYFPFNLDGIRIVLLDTNVKHSLASSEYNTRRRQCESGVRLIRAHHPDVASLRDVTMEQLDRYVAPVDELVYRRCRFIVGENARLLAATADLAKGDLAAFGRKMFETHEGLSREYEVSCRELDFLVEQVKDDPTVIGARMMGGGFGGCTINLVREPGIDKLVRRIAPVYRGTMNKELKVYVARIEDGTSRINL